MRKRVRKDRHRQSLADQIEAPQNNGVRVYPRGSAEKKRKRNEDNEDQALDAKVSGRILKAAREQQEELEVEEAEQSLKVRLGSGVAAASLAAALKKTAGSDSDDDDDEFDDMQPSTMQRSQQGDDEDDDEDPLDAELRAHTLSEGADAAFVGLSLDDDAEEVSPEDEKALAAFMAPNAASYNQVSLGDLVLQKLREKQKEQGIEMLPEEDEEPVPEGLDDKVVQVYRAVGQLLTRYTVGKVPKAFKIIPNLKNWEEVLWLTDPDSWSPQAMYEATKLFVSNLNARLAQRFLALVLLPRIRRDIKEQHKLHFALFMALKKATYKPGAFYKGLLLPLCQSRTCTLREAFILCSVLKRTSIPVLHSAAALLRMADMEYCGTTSFMMKVLLDKKYALPYRVIDSLVDHFVRFADDERQMPVIWHATLLTFVQRYKDEIRQEDREALRKLCTIQSHHLVTPEIIRELDHSRGRGAAASSNTANNGSMFGANASFTPGTGFAKLFGARSGAFLQPQTHIAVIGKNATENVKSLPPVMMLEDD